MFSLKKKSLTKVICAALTFMSALPFGVARAGNEVTVTDSGPDDTGLIDINMTTKTGAVKGNENNELTIDTVTGKYSGYNWYAARVEWGSINKNFLHNNVTVTNSTVGDIYGAWFHYECSGSLDNGNFAGGENTITIGGGTVNGDIYGAYTDQGRGYGNKIYINDSTVKGNVYGSYSNTNSDDLNIINIENSTVKGDIYGGRSGSDLTYYWGQKKRVVAAKAHDNKVNISGTSSIYGAVYGGYSVGGTAYNNQVNITGGTFVQSGKAVYGGYSNTGSVSGNSITVDDGLVYIDNIIGGWSNNDSGYSTININNGEIHSNIYGSYSTNTRSYNNTLNIKGGTIGAADRKSNIYGSYSPNGVAFSNTFDISGGTIYADVYGSYSEKGNSYSNTFNISGDSKIFGNVYGSYSETGNSYSNTFNISGGTISGDVYAGKSSNGTAYNNIVNISAGTVDRIYGGYSDVKAASDNTVNISGGTLTSVYGAYVYSGQTNNNTVNLLAATNVNWLAGGTGTSSSGNTLNVYKYGNTAGTLKDFQNINFIVADKSDTAMLNVTNNGNISGAYIQAAITAAGLKPGDKITLYSGTDVSGAIIPVGDVLSASKIGDITGFYEYLGRYSIDGNKILFTVASEADVPGDYCLTVTGERITNIFGNTPTIDSYTDDKSNKEFAIKFKKSSWTNQLTIDLSEVATYQNYNWYAVRTTGSEAAHGIVNMTSGTAKNIYGGYAAGAGAISDSTVTMTGGTVTDVYGGYAAGSGAASGNTVTVSGGSVTDVYGGYSASGKADKNKVDVKNTTVSGTVYGGKIIGVADASANTVNIKDGTVKGEVYGGYTSGVRYQTSRSYNNTVNIDGSTVNGNIYGGSARLEIFANREIFNNTVNIKDSIVGSGDPKKPISVFGGHSDWGYTSYVNNNTLNITGSSTVTADLYGGRSKENCPVYGNTVKIDALGGTVTGNIYGGWSEFSDIKGSTVNINNGTVTGNIWGGYTELHHSYNNTVNINGGSVTGNIYGSYSQEYNSYGNTVNLNGGTVNGDVYGGKSDSQYSYACYGNTVNINGGTVNGDVYGGYSKKNKAYDNTVNLLTKTTVKNLYGGVGTTPTGNTLNVKEAGNIVNEKLSGFQRVNFDVPNAPLEAGNAILKVKSADFSEFSVINLDKIPTYSLTLLSSDTVIGNYNNLKYYIGGIEYTGGSKTPIKENGHVALKVQNFVSTANEIKWTLGDESFYTGVYYEANGNVIRADGNKAVLTSVPAVSKVYGSYSENAGKSATDGVVELAGKIDSSSLDLIGGKNTAEGGTVGFNTLNVLGTAAGSKVKSVSAFDTINLYAPGYSDKSTPLLNADTINFAAGSTINLDVIPAYSMTLLKWVNITENDVTYKFAGVKGELDKPYFKAMADEVNHRVAVAEGTLSIEEDKSLKWTVKDGAFYTGIYHPRKDAAFPDIVKVTDNKVILDSETAKGVNTVYGSYSEKSDVTAENGIVELAGTVTSDKLELIGGYNSTDDHTNVGNNKLNILTAAAGSSVKTVKDFSEIDFILSDNGNWTTLLTVKEADFSKTNTVKLDFTTIENVPVGTFTLLEWKNKTDFNPKTKYIVIDTEATLGQKYTKAAENKANHRVEVYDVTLYKGDKSLNWDIANGNFYTGYHVSARDVSVATEDKKVVLSSNPADNIKTVYGSYSEYAKTKAEGGTVELAGKIDSLSLDLIGGKNTAGGEVGSNTLNVLGAAAGSNVKSVKDFTNLDFYVPDKTGSMLTVSDAGNIDIKDSKISLEYAPAFDLKLLSATSGTIDKTGTTYFIGEKQLTADADNKYKYFNVANNNTNLLVSKGHIDTSTDISWKNEASILTGKYTDETGKTYSAVNDTIVLDNSFIIPAGTSKIYGSYNETGDATGGNIDIAGSFVCPDIELVGGYSKNSGTVSGNTLNVRSLNNVFKGISGFDNMNFYVPKEAKSEDTMLVIVNPEAEDAKVDLSGVKQIKAGIATGSTLKKDNTINLLATHNGFSGDVPTDMKADLIGTGLVKVDATITQSENKRNIVLKLNEDAPTVLSEDSKSLVETRAAGMALLNNGADLVTGKGFINAKAAAEAENIAIDKHTSFTPYAAVGVNNMRYETGSYVDSNGWGINVGFSRVLNYKDSKLTLAPFVEYGKANYDSYLDNGTHGCGDNSFTGIGFMAKSEQKDGMYYEGSVRLGRSKGDYEGGEMLGEYDTSSNYLAFHAGIGKVQKLSKKSSIDYYGKLFYTHQNGDDVTVTRHEIGDSFVYNFDAINSCRLRLGTRWNQQLGARDVFYAGLAWDYEFGSEARAHYNGLSTPAPTMRGSSGMLELGWKQEATKENPFGVDLGLRGWCGKQRGISFNAGFSWAF